MAEIFAGLGLEVARLRRSTAEVRGTLVGKARAFVAGIYCPLGVRAMRRALAEEKPDLVNVHNLYPFISPAALRECRRAGVPVVMTVHNFRLICPTGLFMRDGGPCELCLERGNEWGCVRHNCEHSRLKSLGYAARNAVARLRRHYIDCVDVFACITEFQRRKLIEAGFPPERIVVIPNCAETGAQGRTGTQQGAPTTPEAQAPGTQQPATAHQGPTEGPTQQPAAANQGPTEGPTQQPAAANQGPTKGPTQQPAAAHQGPTKGPTQQPAAANQGPTEGPTQQPAAAQQGPTEGPTQQPAAANQGPTKGPTQQPAAANQGPTEGPTQQPAAAEVVSSAPGLCRGDYVGFCGRISREKGIDLIAEAARRHPEIGFRLAGAVGDPELVADLPPNVKMTGFLRGRDLEDFYEGARFVVMASRCYEGFPMAILEAARHSRATVAPDHGGFTEIVSGAGVLFRPGDADSLAEAVSSLWHDPQRAATLGRNAAERLRERYATPVVAARWGEIVERLTGRKPAEG